MRKKLVRRNPWLETVRALGQEGVEERHFDTVRKHVSSDAYVERNAAKIAELSQNISFFEVLECPTPLSAIVSWSDPKLGHNGYERWRMRRARTQGRCALSGKAISPGDLVFLPAVASQLLAQRGAMFLATDIPTDRQTYLFAL